MRALLLRSFASALVLGSVHCGGTASPHATTLSKGTPSDPIATAPMDSSATPVTSTSAAPAAPVSPFTPVAALPTAARFFAVDGALLVSWPNPEGFGHVVRAIVDGALVSEPKLDLENGISLLLGISGGYPNSLVAIAVSSTGRTGISEHHVRGPNGWKQESGDEGYVFTGFARTKDALVALRTPAMMWPTHRPSLRAIRGSAGGRTLQPLDKKFCETFPGNPAPPTSQVTPTLFGGTGAGAFFSFGTTCTQGDAVEVWLAGQKTSTVTKLPTGVSAPEWDQSRVATNDGETAWVLSGDAPLFFDGASWATVDAAPEFKSGVLASDGTLWGVSARGTLHKGDAKRGFEEVLVPSGAVVDDVGIAADGSVWISAGNALLRTGTPTTKPPVVDVAKASSGSKAQRKAPPKFGGPACKSNVVVLYGFTKVTPDDYDFPLTRKALKGRTEFAKSRFVVTKDGGQKFFSAIVPTFDEGKKLVSVIEKNVQGSKPQIVCAEPEILRELKLDLATGEISK